MDQAFNFIVVAIVAVCVWLALRPNYAFVIAIENGTARVSKGKVAHEFVEEVSEVCGRRSVRRGWVGGIARGRTMKLAFSNSIPAACRQQLRNLWSIHV